MLLISCKNKQKYRYGTPGNPLLNIVMALLGTQHVAHLLVQIDRKYRYGTPGDPNMLLICMYKIIENTVTALVGIQTCTHKYMYLMKTQKGGWRHRRRP